MVGCVLSELVDIWFMALVWRDVRVTCGDGCCDAAFDAKPIVGGVCCGSGVGAFGGVGDAYVF